MNGSTLAIWLYAIFALGGVGVYFALPQEGRWPGRAPVILGLGSLVGLLVLLYREYGALESAGGSFYLFAAICLFAAVRVITHSRPVYSALYFVLVVVAVAGMMVLLSAEFLAAALIIVYAGAILVTYVFVIMLSQHATQSRYDADSHAPFGAVLAGFLLVAVIAGSIADATLVNQAGKYDPRAPVAPAGDTADLPAGNTVAVGANLLSRYVVPLELAGVLLLIAMIGALTVARKHVPPEEGDEAPVFERPLGEAGRQAPPFSPEMKQV